MNRRYFLRATLAAAAGGAATAAWARAYNPKARLACNSWPFRGYFDTPAMHHYRDPSLPLLDQVQFPTFLADTFGIHAVEFLPQHFAETGAAYVAQVRAGVRKAHARVVNLMGVEIPGGLYNPRLDAARALAAGRLWIDIAAALGCPSATFVLGGPPPFDAKTAAANLRPILAYARSRRVKVLFHNDDIRRESADLILAVLAALDSPDAGTCPDFGNFAPKSPAYALETLKRLIPHATNICHAKDGIAENGKFYADDFAASMRATKAAGFRGHYSLEFEGLGPAVAGVRALMAKTLRYL